MNLDEKQLEVVNSTANNILVIAGAGSGKTACLTARIRHLLEIGVEPNNIVAITFTNMAAEEMRERLNDVDNIGDVFIGTIHSFASKILHTSGESYKIYSSELDMTYHAYLIDKYCKKLTTLRYAEYCKLQAQYELGEISENELNNFFTPDEAFELHYIHRDADTVEEYVRNGGQYYQESIDVLCKRNNVITFDELIEKADMYFRSLNIRLSHLLVDEFQDIGNLEWGFIRSLDAENNFFIGDDYQAIYGFKGSNVRIFKSLATNNKYTVYKLSNNYRNSQNILKIAERVIAQVPDRITKITAAKNKDIGNVTVKARNKFSSFVQQTLKQDDTNYSTWFILTRSNKELNEILMLLKEFDIPCSTVKREGMTLAELREQMSNNTVKVMTVHSAKGLEIKNVALYGNFPVVCPSYRRNDEERRVMYVGITRAIDNLVIFN